MLGFLADWLIATWELISFSALWLLVGFSIAGLLHVFIPQRLINRHLKRPGFASVFKSSAFGVPIPLCSCSVIPVGASLRREGASKGATASFFVSTPEIGVDSFLLSYALLGPLIAVGRVVSSFVSALGIGVTIDSFVKEDHEASDTVTKSCCSTGESQNALSGSRLQAALRFGFVDILDDLAVVLTFGFFLAGFVAALVPDDFFLGLGLSPALSMLIMLGASLPVYVCATSSTPLAAALLLKGLNPGAVLVFLLAGPATNISTMLVLRKEIGAKALSIYLTGIVVVSVLSGILLNVLVGAGVALGASDVLQQEHDHGAFRVLIPGVIFSGLLLFSLLKRVRKRVG